MSNYYFKLKDVQGCSFIPQSLSLVRDQNGVFIIIHGVILCPRQHSGLLLVS